MITLEEFQRADIRIGKVVSAERLPDSDKLLKIIFDIGEENGERKTVQILSGIAEYVGEPSSLVGKEMPVILNLEPRKMRGEMSYGMLLAADADGRPTLLHPSEEVPAGSMVK